MNQGQIKINENEACIVRRIYSDYAAGQSYKKIAEMLTAEGIRYMPQKPVWNKNMVARILQNQNYLGNRKFPGNSGQQLI